MMLESAKPLASFFSVVFCDRNQQISYAPIHKPSSSQGQRMNGMNIIRRTATAWRYPLLLPYVRTGADVAVIDLRSHSYAFPSPAAQRTLPVVWINLLLPTCSVRR